MNPSRITADPEVMFGKPVVRGTRIPVELILRELRTAGSFEALLRYYPGLELEDVQAALDYAAEHLQPPVVAAA